MTCHSSLATEGIARVIEAGDEIAGPAEIPLKPKM